jgi:hypothetical protein
LSGVRYLVIKQEEQKKEEETAEQVADEIAGELGVGTGTKIAEIAEDTALSVLEHGGSPQEANDAAAEAAEVRSQLMHGLSLSPDFAVWSYAGHTGCQLGRYTVGRCTGCLRLSPGEMSRERASSRDPLRLPPPASRRESFAVSWDLQEEEEKEEELASFVGSKVTAELGIGSSSTKIAEVAEDTALSVLENGGSPEEVRPHVVGGNNTPERERLAHMSRRCPRKESRGSSKIGS